MTELRMTRRESLIYVAALSLLGLPACSDDGGALVSGRTELAAAARVGAQCLEALKPSGGASALALAICGDADPSRFESDPEFARTVFQQRHQADLDSADLVEVSGWMLSRSEARLYALIALTHG